MVPVTCTKCKKKCVIADAGLLASIPYRYCQTCKIELDYRGYEVLLKDEDLEELEEYLSEEVSKWENEGNSLDLELDFEEEFRDTLDTFGNLYYPQTRRK